MKVVTFSITEQSFEVFTMEQWASMVDSWRIELEENLDDVDSLDADDIVDYYHGEELFWEVIDI